MNRDEAIRICRLAKAASPAQAVDEYTPDLWALVLAPHRYEDAELALTELAGEQEWIHVSHVKSRIKRIRAARVSAFGVLPEPPPTLDPSDTDAYNTYLAETTKAIADGTLTKALPSSRRAVPGPPELAAKVTELVAHEKQRSKTLAKVCEPPTRRAQRESENA